MNKNIFVVAGVIIFDKKILCVQRGINKYKYISEKFEFPGGKIEENEADINALHREILEELSMDINVDKFFMAINHHYPDFFLNMKVYLCSSKSNVLLLSEHISYQWLSVDKIKNLDWAAADIPIVKKLLSNNIF